MVADRTRELLFPITVLVSVAVGVVIGSVFARTESSGHSLTSTPGSDSKAVVDAVDAVRAELVRMRERLDANPMSVPASEKSDTRSTATPDTAGELQRATAALVQAADSLRAASNRAGGDRAPLVIPAAVDPKPLEELMAQSGDEGVNAYQMWTYQQVMDRFGPPDSVGTETSGLYWMYRDHADGIRSVLFHFVDGRVTYVVH